MPSTADRWDSAGDATSSCEPTANGNRQYSLSPIFLARPETYTNRYSRLLAGHHLIECRKWPTSCWKVVEATENCHALVKCSTHCVADCGDHAGFTGVFLQRSATGEASSSPGPRASRGGVGGKPGWLH